MSTWSYEITSFTNNDIKSIVTFDIYQDDTKITTRTIIVNGGKSEEFLLRKVQQQVMIEQETVRNDTKLTALQNVKTIVSSD